VRPASTGPWLALLILHAAASATAQEPDGIEPLPTIPVQSREAEEPAPRDRPEPAELETIVVTGEKLGRSAFETTSSAAVLTGRNIEDQGDESLGDLLRRVANTMASEEGSLAIRGVAQNGVNGAEGAPLISIQVDGATLDDISQESATEDLFDVDQVEILRGAQSTSQGRNALAGAVVVRTRDPTPYWDLRTRAATTFDEQGTSELAAAGGGPLWDALAFRLAGRIERDDGFITHLPEGDPDFAQSDETMGRAKLAYTPGWLPGLRSLLTFSYSRFDGQPDYNIESEAAGDAARRTSTANEPSRDLVQTQTGSLETTYEWSERLRLTSITAFMDTGQDYLRDYDGADIDGGRNDLYADGRNVTQELRLAITDWGTDWGRFNGVVGFYGGRFSDDLISRSTDIIIRLGEVLPVPLLGDLVEAQTDTEQTTLRDADNLALFTEFDVGLPWRLTATLGLRYDRETLDYRNSFETQRADGYVVTPAGLATIPLAGELLDAVLAQVPRVDLLPLLQPLGLAPDTNGFQGGRTTYKALLPKLGLRYALRPNLAVFLTYTEAYRAGGISVDSAAGEAIPFDPEYTRTFEAGVRGSAAGRRLEFGANAYHTSWRDQQVTVPVGFFFITQNATRSRLVGGEFDAAWRPLSSLRLTLALGYSDTEFLDYSEGGEDYSGNQFVLAPRFTGSLGAVWRGPLGLFAGGNFSRADHYFTTPENDERERGDARDLLDLKLGWEGRRVKAFLFGRNLLDEDYLTESFVIEPGAGSPAGTRFAAYGRPRVLGLQVEFRL
jgi:outer membrane receptor protein involved in Fe transport